MDRIYKVGDIVNYRGHVCIVTEIWDDEGKYGVTITPVENYGFPIDIYEEQVYKYNGGAK